ncbi:peptidoglycan-binding protein [Streptomyces sp. NPDC048484]|uniref:peptidoglycan-binding protein n=1 Tax=Streptomyces sp. NPDC048484 TaxID=3155146 RepID=UPI003444D86C
MSRHTSKVRSPLYGSRRPSDPGQEFGAVNPDAARQRSARRTALIAGGVVIAVAAGGVVLVPHWTQTARSPSKAATASVSSAMVRRTDLSDSVSMDGTLDHGSPRAINSSSTGTVTWLPAVGATIRRGHPLYRVDNRPAVVFHGSTPLYRRLDTVGMVGPDVRVVADNLRALGYDIGVQPPAGALVAPSRPDAAQESAGSEESEGARKSGGAEESEELGEAKGAEATSGSSSPAASGSPSPAASSVPQRVQPGDSVLTQGLMAAIKRWQRDTRVPETSVLEPGDVVVTTGTVRVAQLKVKNGDAASGELLSVTGTGKRVTVQASEGDSSAFRKGNTVEVTLPDGSALPGRISVVGTMIRSGSEEGGDAGSNPTRTITVVLDEGRKGTAAVRSVDSAPVQVRFTGRTRKDVLVVPVGALLALSEGGYAVQLRDGKLIKVTTGLFAKGLVEISGSVTAGTKVVTTS